MGKLCSLDLRKRVVAAILTGGLSCNQSAEQFGVAVSTAIGWVRRHRETLICAAGVRSTSDATSVMISRNHASAGSM
jgi:transposase